MERKKIIIIAAVALIVGVGSAIMCRAYKNSKEMDEAYNSAVSNLKDKTTYVASITYKDDINSISDAQMIEAKTDAEVNISADMKGNYIKCSGQSSTEIKNKTTDAASNDKSSFCLYGTKEADVYYRYQNTSYIEGDTWKKLEADESIMGKNFLNHISEMNLYEQKKSIERSNIVVNGNVRGEEIKGIFADIADMGAGSYYINSDIISNLNSIKCTVYINRKTKEFVKIEFDFKDSYSDYMNIQSLDNSVNEYKMSINFKDIGKPITCDIPDSFKTLEITQEETEENVSALE